MRRAAALAHVLLCLGWVGAVLYVLLPLAIPSALPEPGDVASDAAFVELSPAVLAGRPLILPAQAYARPRTDAEWRALEAQAELPRLVRNGLLAGAIGVLALSLPVTLAILAWTLRLLARPFQRTR